MFCVCVCVFDCVFVCACVYACDCFFVCAWLLDCLFVVVLDSVFKGGLA